MQNALKKVISIILIASLMMTNFCVYVKASDFKLSVIYLFDAIEDIEYRERESVYESEHLSFLMKEESTESEISEEIEVDEEEEVIEANSHEDNIHVDEFKNESDSIDESDDIVSTESEADEDKKQSTCEESSPSEVYQSNHTDEFYELEVSTLSEIKTIKTNKSTTSFIDEDTFLGATPAVEVFDLPITGGKYSVRAKTKKSSRGGQTFDGLLICGQVQAGVKSTDRYLLVECANADRHKVEFNLYKEDPNIGEMCVYSETATNIGGTFSYPNYGTPVFPEEEKEFNVQIEIPYDRNGSIFSLDRLYHATEKASGCENVSNVEPVDPDSTITPMPMKNKHTGGIAYDSVGAGAAGHPNTIGDSIFLLYKVKYGDNLLKIALHYGVELADIAKDNHFSNLMCYEGDILFIRDPSFDEPYEKELTTAELASIKAELALMGYDVEHCDFFGEPINMSTGDFYLSHIDVEVEELGDEKFNISRSYNSKGRKIKSDFGYGFSSVVNDRLMVSSDGTVIHFDNDGGGEIYKNAGSGLYKTNTNGNVVKAIKNESGDEYATDEYDDSGGDDNPGDGGSVGRSNNWQLIYEDGSIATYNGYGSILSKKDRHGLTYTYNYDSSYRLSSIVTPSGFTFSFSYNGSNLIEKLTMPDGNSIKYEYDGDKNLVRVIDQENRATRYEYDSDHKMTAWYDADDIRQVLNTYDSSGRVVKQIDANGSESTLRYESDKTVVTDNEGNEQVYVLDDTKRTIGKEFTTSSSVGGVSHLISEYARTFNSDNKTETKTDGNGVETTYAYDIRGNVLSEEKTDGTYTISRLYTYDTRNNKTSETDFNGNVTTYEYDSRNNLIKVIDPSGNTEEMAYDSLSRVTSKKDKNGNITRYMYSGTNPLPESIIDARGSVTQYTYDGMRRKTSETDGEGYTTSFTYDRTGRKVKEVDKRGNETKYTYSGRGVVIRIEDRESNSTTFTYDNVGNILSGRDAEGSTLNYEYDLNYNKVLEKDSLQNETKKVYNEKGQVTEEIDALGHSKRYTLDGIGNVIEETDRNGNTTKYKYNNVLNKVIEKTDENGKITKYEYDSNGNLLKEIKPDRSEKSYEYDALNQLIKATNEEGAETDFTHDPNGNVVKKVIGTSALFGNGIDSISRKTEYVYDECNNLIEEKSPNGYINKCEYDRVGNIVKLIDENNYIIEYTYDGNSNITKVKDAKGHEEEYTYDKENRKKTYKDKNGNITTFSYDRAGRVIEKVNALNEKEEIEYDSNDNIIKNTLYNADGTIFSETNKTYNALNKLTEEKDAENYTTSYTYDNNENITSITNKNGDTKTFTYDASNHVISETDEMGLTTEYEYDDNYNIIKISDNSSVGASIASPIEYREYDRLGNLTKVTDAIGRVEEYTYNIFGENIKKVDKDNSVTIYNYDNNGNLSKVVRPDNEEIVYTYDKHNKLIKTKLNEAVYEYTYDKNYNVIKEKNPLGNTKEYTYDNEGNTTQIKDEEDSIITNEYDHIGRLIKKTDGNGNDTKITYDRNSNITEIKTPENITNKYEYDKEGRLVKEIDGENHYIKYEYDGMGNIIKKTTESNEVTTYTYDKHNVMTSVSDALGNTERYETNLNSQVVKKTQKDGTEYKYNYDKVKRLISTIDPMNYKMDFEYSLGDDIIKTTDNLGRQIDNEYDKMHNLIRSKKGTISVGGSGNVGVSPYTEELWFYDYRGNITRHIDKREKSESFTYDLADNLIAHKDKNENTTRYTYDKVGNILEVIEPNGALTKYEYDSNYNRIKLINPRGKETRYTYDKDNRLISETDPLGNIKRYSYNNNNNLKEYTTALGNTAKYVYDTDNNLVKEIDPRNKEKTYTYDKLHRLTKTTSELNNTAIFTYDKVDNVVGIKDPKGTNTIFDYNNIGKVVQERSIDNTIRTYSYDRAGRLISKINKDRTKIAYDYDEYDNIIKKYYLDLNNKEIDDSVSYVYNAENSRLGMRDKSGLSRTLYDNNGNMILSSSNNDKDIVRYEYDSNNRLIKMKYPTGVEVRYTYDENGNIKTATDKDGLKTTYTYDENDREVIRTTGLIETNKRYDADGRLIRIKNEHRFTGELIDEYSYRYDSNNNIVEEIKREPYKKKVEALDITPKEESDRTIRVTKQTFSYDAENKLIDAKVERLGMKGVSEPNITTYHYEYDENGNRTLVDIKDDNLTLESTVYIYDRLNRMIRSKEVTRDGLYIYEYKYDDNGNLISEDRHREYEIEPVFYTNIRRYEYTKDNKLEAVYSGSTLLVAYTYGGDGTITSSLDRDLDLNQNLNINDHSYISRLTKNQRELINKVLPSDSFLYEFTEYVLDRNRPYVETLMERDGAGNLSTLYTYGNQRINSESYNNLSGLYTYDGRGSVSAVMGGYGDFRATYWYDGLGNVKNQIHGYGAFGSGKKYYGYNAEQYNPVTGNQNLRARQLNIRRQRFLSEDTYIGNNTDTLSLNRYIYARNNPLKYFDPTGFDYKAAVWLLNENGAYGAGHAAIMLVDDEDKAEYYSYAASNENLADVYNAIGTGSPGYLSTLYDTKNNDISTISFSKFISIDNGVISISDDINHQKEGAVEAQYTYAIYIPISNEQGIAMHDKALDIRENPGTYHLVYHNCNQVTQEILDAGGERFDYSFGWWFNTMPNNVRNSIIESIKYNTYTDKSREINPSNIYKDYWDWKFGSIEELSSILAREGCAN